MFYKVKQIDPKLVDDEPSEKTQEKEAKNHQELVKKTEEPTANQQVKGDEFELLK
jgi:hypothetical protein